MDYKLIEKAIGDNDLSSLKLYTAHLSEYSASTDISPLMLASELGRLQIVKYLSDYVDINQVNQTNCSALMYAAFYGKSDIVIYLCNKGANPNIASTNGENAGETALMYACWKCNYDAVKALIDAGANVNAARKYGDRFTPLMYAMANVNGGYIRTIIIQLLIKAGADVDATNSEGHSIKNFSTYKSLTRVNPDTLNYAPGGEGYYKAGNHFKGIQYEDTPLELVANLVNRPERKSRKTRKTKKTRKSRR